MHECGSINCLPYFAAVSSSISPPLHLDECGSVHCVSVYFNSDYTYLQNNLKIQKNDKYFASKNVLNLTNSGF